MTDIEYIAQKLSREDILCQLAEEAADPAPFPSMVVVYNGTVKLPEEEE